MDPFGFKTILITCLIFVPLERLFALHPNRKVFRRGWHTDVIYLLLNGALIKLGLLGVILVVAFLASQVVPAPLREFVGGQPYWLQLVEAVILSDIGFYWTDRMFHAVPWLWRFHAIHHSIEELDWLAASRVHPVDQILTKGVSIIPIVALGFSDVTIGLYALLYQWQSVLIHATSASALVNCDGYSLRLNFTIGITARSLKRRIRTSRVNFLSLMRCLEAYTCRQEGCRSVMEFDQPIPVHYFPQLVYPFSPARSRRPDSTEATPTSNEPIEVSRPSSV